MRYGDFIAKVADRAGVPPEDAERAAQAVLSTLAERIGEKEAAETAAQLPKELQPQPPQLTVDQWDDTVAELPREYDELLA